MSKKIKAVIYGEPGVGKSYFANQFPKRFFICTDGNYEWLPNAKDKDHIQIDSWSKFKDINMKMDFANYDCIVIDLLEDLFDWCKYETCKAAGVKHISELGDYGKGYDIVYTNFLAEIFKLLAKDKSIILIVHGRDTTYKDKFGIDHVYHTYTNFLPDKVIVPIEGRVRCFLRAFEETELDPVTKKTKTLHKLSFIPQADEFGINRGEFNENTPYEIPLNMQTFLTLMNFYDDEKIVAPTKEAVKEAIKTEETKTDAAKEVPVVEEVKEQQDEKHEASANNVDLLASIFAKAGIKTETKLEEKTVETEKKPIETKAETTEQVEAKDSESDQPKKIDIASILAMVNAKSAK